MDFAASNADILSALASQLQSGKLTAEEASKLLNTVARFEERVTDVTSPSSGSVEPRR